MNMWCSFRNINRIFLYHVLSPFRKYMTSKVKVYDTNKLIQKVLGHPRESESVSEWLTDSSDHFGWLFWMTTFQVLFWTALQRPGACTDVIQWMMIIDIIWQRGKSTWLPTIRLHYPCKFSHSGCVTTRGHKRWSTPNHTVEKSRCKSSHSGCCLSPLAQPSGHIWKRTVEKSQWKRTVEKM